MKKLAKPKKKHPLHHHAHHHPAHHHGQHPGKLNLTVPVPAHHHHKPKATRKPKKAHKPRGLAIGSAWACCSAEALGASLRLAGWPVGDADVLALHVAAGGTRDAGVPIAAALETAAHYGLAERRPVFAEYQIDDPSLPFGQLLRDVLDPDFGEVDDNLGRGPAVGGRFGHGLIVGAELPGAHALAADCDGAWTWGEWHPWECFGGAVIEEAWEVTWP